MPACHYCPAPGVTKDHVIPRHRVRKKVKAPPHHPFYVLNVVPCCEDCNQRKKNRFPTCGCGHCRCVVVMYVALTTGQLVKAA